MSIMRALKMPFHVDLNGRVATTTTYADLVQSELVDVLMTNQMERVMRPTYGADLQRSLFDPSDELVRSDAARQVMTSIQHWAPRVNMRTVRFSDDKLKPGAVFCDVTFQAGAFAEVRALRMPVSPTLDQETPI
jgi:phage baseplate assembly protein W